MIIIWGSKDFNKVLCQTGPYTCTNCSNPTPFNLVRVARWFTLFWIPIFPYSFKYYHFCPVCNQGVQLTKQQAKDMQAQFTPQGQPGGQMYQ